MLKYFLSIFVLTTAWADHVRKPMYQYRYQTEDIMNTDATSIPVRGYHVVQGGYYPEKDFGEYSGDFGRFRGVDRGFVGSERLIDSPGEFGGRYHSPLGDKFIGGGYGGSGFIGSEISPSLHHHHHHGVGGEYLDKHVYSEGDKKLDDDSYDKASGKKGESFNHGQEGYNQDKVALKSSKGDSGYYNEEAGGKKSSEDGKDYHGSQHHNQEGKNGEENNQKGSHKKGHVIKGFKKSHHKDEDGKTEEFYDEEHDEGGNYNYGGKSGSFGENVASSYKGGHDNGEFKSAQNKKEGHHDSKHAVDNSNADKGAYGQNKFSEKGEVYGIHNGLDQHSLLGHQEANRIFKHHPYHVPFFPAY